MNKKNGLIIIFSIIIGIILGFLLFYFLPKNIGKVKSEVISKTELESLVKNNYDLAYLIYGDVNVADGSIEFNNQQYNYFSDSKLPTIVHLEDINNLISATIVENKKTNVYDLTIENNNYIELDNKLVVRKNIKKCVFNGYNINDFTYEKINDNLIKIKYNGKEVMAEKVDNNWYTQELLFSCSNS